MTKQKIDYRFNAQERIKVALDDPHLANAHITAQIATAEAVLSGRHVHVRGRTGRGTGVSDYSNIFGREPEPWREPLGALRLTLADESAPAWQIERARAECEALVKALNEHPSADQGKPQITDDDLIKTYWGAVDRAMSWANARDGYGSSSSRESIVAGLRAVLALGEKNE